MKKISLLTGVISLSLIGIVSAQQYGNCPMGSFGGMMYGFSGGYGAGMMIFSWVISVLVIALITAAIYWLVKSASNKKQ